MALDLVKFVLGLCAPGIVGSAPIVNPTTWDPANKTASITLSNGNLTAAASAGAQGVRGTNARADKRTVTYTCTGSSSSAGIGFEDVTNALTADGTTTLAASIQGSTTVGLVINNVIQTTGLNISGTGNVIDVAVDFPNKLLWYRSNGGLWNGRAGADPVTGAGGLSLAAYTGTSLFPAMWSGGTGAGFSVVANFNNPLGLTGFKTWDAP